MLVYVAGAYRGKSKYRLINRLQVMRNIYRAWRVARELWGMGYTVICPHANSALMDSVAPNETFLKGDIEMLKKCDGIVMLPGWVYSAGAVREYMVAIDRGMKVMHWDEMEGLNNS